MKHIKLFENFINELEVQDELWGDVDKIRGGAVQYSDLFKEFNLKKEVNTEDEDSLIVFLKKWTNRGIKTEELGKMLKELLPLKSKFSKILDPAENKVSKKVWRATAVPIRDMIKLKGWQEESYDGSGGSITTTAQYTYKIRSRGGFTSFTADFSTVLDFVGEVGIDNDSTVGDWCSYLESGNLNVSGAVMTVIFEISVDQDNLIMNPDVSNAFSAFKEYETFYIGKTVNVDKIIVPEWDSAQNLIDDKSILNKNFQGI